MKEYVRYQRFRRRLFWGRLFDQLGGRPTPRGILRSKRTVCKLLKLAELEGYYS